MKETKERGGSDKVFTLFFVALVCVFFMIAFAIADPTGVGAGNVDVVSNETFAGQTTGDAVNISGGYIAAINITANVVNQK